MENKRSNKGQKIQQHLSWVSRFFWEGRKSLRWFSNCFVILLNWKDDMLWNDCYWNSGLVLIAKCHYLLYLDHCWELLIENSLKPKNVGIGTFQEPAYLGLAAFPKTFPKSFPYLCSKSLLFHINSCLMIRTRNTRIVKGYCKNRTKPHLLFLC